ncbi:MAG: NUDIX domain-containing protein [Bdellovibrio sp.]
MEKTIKEIKLARGILFRNESVLLVQDIRPGQGHYFLPGGNVEPGQSIKETLPREWREELGWDINVSTFLGCLENKWEFKRKHDGAIVEMLEVNSD